MQIPEKLRKIVDASGAFFNMLLLAISPLALLMLIVAFIMLMDNYGTHRRLHEALGAIPQTATATIAGCYEENRYCYADFIDADGRERFGRLDRRYYPTDIRLAFTALERGRTVVVRYAQQEYENEIILAEHYDSFASYKGYLFDSGIVALVSWVILILHPEVMLFSLVDNLNQIFDAKWKKTVQPLQDQKSR